MTGSVGTAVTEIAAFTQVVALSADGTAYAWGTNDRGQLGIGRTGGSVDMPTPVALPDGVNLTSVDAGNVFSLGLSAAGNVYAWGADWQGRLGNGAEQNVSIPTPARILAPAGTTFTAISAGFSHGLALSTEGNVYAWGSGAAGQLGDGQDIASGTISEVPVRVQAPAGTVFTAIEAGSLTSVALSSEGDVYAWGLSGGGFDATVAGVSTPQRVPLPTRAGVTVTDIAADVSAGLMMALTSAGEVYAWGDTFVTNTPGSLMPRRVEVPSGVPITGIAVGARAGFLTDTQGTVYAVGQNFGGQLGDGTLVARRAPVRVLTPSGVYFTAVTAGLSFALGLDAQGNVYGWGNADAPWMVVMAPAGVASSLVPVPMQLGSPATTSVRSVTFDGAPGTGLVQSGLSWTVETPPGCGVVDVIVEYTRNGTQRSRRFPGGFEFGSPPVVTTEPTDLLAERGAQVTLTAAASGDGTPVVRWQTSEPGSNEWTDLPGASEGTLTMNAEKDMDVRAVFTNCRAEVPTRVAQITVEGAASVPTIAGNPGRGVVGVAFGYEFSLSGYPELMITDGDLPQGLTLNAASGTLSGTPAQAGEFPIEITATNEAGSVTWEGMLTIYPLAASHPGPAPVYPEGDNQGGGSDTGGGTGSGSGSTPGGGSGDGPIAQTGGQALAAGAGFVITGAAVIVAGLGGGLGLRKWRAGQR